MVQKSLGQLLINYKLSIMSYAPPLYIPEGHRERGGKTELIKGVVFQLSDSESYRIVS